MIYKLVIGACLALALKIILVGYNDWASVAALFVFALSGLGVHVLEQIDFVTPETKQLQDRCDLYESRFVKLEAHVERLDNRTRPPGR